MTWQQIGETSLLILGERGGSVKKEDKRQLLSAFGMVGNVGITMVASAVVGLFGGRFLDEKLGISPWATVIGILLGLVAGMWSSYKQVMRKDSSEG